MPKTDANLWAERFDGDVGNLFALQDDITRRIAIALNLELINRAAGRPTEHTDALDYILRGRAASNKTPSRAAHMEAILLFERALALDPESIEAQSRLAIALADRVLNNMTDTTAADLDRAEGLIRRTLTAAPDSTLAHFANGELLRARRRYAKAIPEYEMVLASNRNALGAYFGLSHAKLFVGSVEEAIPLTEQAIRLSPRDPGLGIWYLQIGRVRSWQSRPAEAIFWLEKARTQIPANSITRSELAAAYALDGQTERAADELAEARRLAGDGRYRSNAHLKAAAFFGEIAPSVHAMAEATLFAGLRKAGMPEQ